MRVPAILGTEPHALPPHQPLNTSGTGLYGRFRADSARSATADSALQSALPRVSVTRKRDTASAASRAASGLSTARMAAVVPAGLALVFGLPLLVEAGAELRSHLSGWGAEALAVAILAGMALVWRAVLRAEVRA